MKRLNLILVIINSDYRWYLKQNVYKLFMIRHPNCHYTSKLPIN